MAKVITFSKTFPAYHPKAGQETKFREKLILSLVSQQKVSLDRASELLDMPMTDIKNLPYQPKHHTIRAGHRFKAGDYFSPREWSDKPYKSKQTVLSHDLLIEKTFDIEIDGNRFIIDGKPFYHQHVSEFHFTIEELAKNDGLSCGELFRWFQLPCKFKGQIICWNPNIEY